MAMEGYRYEDTEADKQLFQKCLSDSREFNESMLNMIIGGAPYLYPEDGPAKGLETIIDKCTRFSNYDVYEAIVERHKEESTEEREVIFKTHIEHALEIAAETNDELSALVLMLDNRYAHNMFRIAAKGGWRILDKFEEKDLDLNAGDQKDGYTMLHHAAVQGRASTVKYLIERGANPNRGSGLDDGFTPLIYAALNGSDNDITLAILIENSNTNKVLMYGGATVLNVIANKGKHHFVQRLIELGADPDQRDQNGVCPFIEAAKNGHLLTVKAFVMNGATLSLLGKDGKTALDHSLENKKDATSAMLIRLDKRKDCLEKFTQRYENTEHNIEKLIKARQRETIVALLDRSVSEEEQKVTLNLDIWESGKVLERLVKWEDEELAYHGTIRMLVDAKMKKFGYKMLFMKILFFILFLLVLSYSLVQASAAGIPRDTYTEGFWNIFRIFSDLFVLGYFFYNLSTECIEVFRIMRNTHEYLQNKRSERIKLEKKSKIKENEENKQAGEDKKESLRTKILSLKRRLYNIFCVRVLVDYFYDLSNVFDTLGLSSLLLLVILRVARQPVQWVFATLTFFLNAARIFKFIVLIPRLGPYSTIIFRILIKDVPLFSSLFAITLFIFTGGYFISLRTPYSPQGFSNASLVQDTERTPGVDDRVQWVFLSGLRVLLEGNVYESNYLYNQLNWLAASIYLTFLFLTVVVFLNVFIAQLSDRYAEVKVKANQLFALQKLNFVVQVQTTSVLSCFIDFKKKYKMEEKSVTPEEMLTYYHSSDPASLNETAINAVKPTKHYPQIPPLRYWKNVSKNKPESENQVDRMRELIPRCLEKIESLVAANRTLVYHIKGLESKINILGQETADKFQSLAQKNPND